MTAPTTNQIGYQTAIKFASTSASNNGNTFGTLTLSPVGSVWFLNANLIVTSSQAMAFTTLTIQTGTTYTYGNSMQSIGGSSNSASVTSGIPIYMNCSGVYAVTSGNQTVCYGAWFNTTASTVTLGTTCMTATRIA